MIKPTPVAFSAGLCQVFGMNSFFLVQGSRNFSERVRSDDSDKVGFCSESGSRDCLVGSFAAGTHVELRTYQGFSKHRHPLSAQGHSDGKAADDGYDWPFHSMVLSEHGFVWLAHGARQNPFFARFPARKFAGDSTVVHRDDPVALAD